MKLIKFPEVNTIYAENQPEYLPLPAYKKPDDPQGEIICCWNLSFKERIKLLFAGKIWHLVLTFNKPLQPQLLMVNNPFMPIDTIIMNTDGKEI